MHLGGGTVSFSEPSSQKRRADAQGVALVPGMGGPSPVDDPTVVSAFHAALGRQALVILAFFALLAIIWNVVGTVQFRRLAGSPAPAGKSPAPLPHALGVEPVARRVIRIGFGLMWICDGLLQLQSAMPLGTDSGVLQPAEASSRGWVPRSRDKTRR